MEETPVTKKEKPVRKASDKGEIVETAVGLTTDVGGAVIEAADGSLVEAGAEVAGSVIEAVADGAGEVVEVVIDVIAGAV